MKEKRQMIYSISKEKTALLIIDAQREYFDSDKPLYTENSFSIKNHLVSLREICANQDILTVFIQHCHNEDGSDVGRMGDFDPTPVFTNGTEGVEIIPELKVKSTDIVVKKTRYSAFVNTELESILKTKGIDTLIITGLMTNYCSVTTARHAHDLDYKVIFVTDANAGPDMPDLGFGAIDHDLIMKVVATSMAGGVAEPRLTKDLIQEIQNTK